MDKYTISLKTKWVHHINEWMYTQNVDWNLIPKTNSYPQDLALIRAEFDADGNFIRFQVVFAVKPKGNKLTPKKIKDYNSKDLNSMKEYVEDQLSELGEKW